MTRTASVVIGANYGDEGKGLVTDYLASERPAETVVVRFSGGANAGHTVVTPEGDIDEGASSRHVFHHFGSGTLAGAGTYLSSHFLVNPILFHTEHRKLRQIGVTPDAPTVSSRCLVTTPYDMVINQEAERARGDGRHGSCGVGVNETEDRSQHYRARLTVSDLHDKQLLYSRLKYITSEWAERRLARHGVVKPSFAGLWEILGSDEYLGAFMVECQRFLDAVHVSEDAVIRDARRIVFEGSQGLALDQHRGDFPYVTRASTGLTNVFEVANAADLDELHVYYVTRAYLTRHGAGPLPREGELPFEVADETNQPNDWQGRLRTAPLDVDALAARVKRDFAEVGTEDRAAIALTCTDHWPDPRGVVWYSGGERRTGTVICLIEAIEKATGMMVELASAGPTRGDVERRYVRAGHPAYMRVPASPWA